MGARARWLLGSLAAAIGTALAAPPDDPLHPLQWGLGPDGINVEGAWARGLDGSGVSIGVVDGGGVPHEDLPFPEGGYDFISDPQLARDGDGRDPDPTDEGNWTYKYASNWHGTHVAGTLNALSDNGIGIAGIAPGATVEHLRVAGSEEDAEFPPAPAEEDLADALIWAAGGDVAGVPTREAPLDIVVVTSPTYGSGEPCEGRIREAVEFATTAGTIIVASAQGLPDRDAGDHAPGSCPGVINVGSVGPRNTYTEGSPVGDVIAVAAPGGGPWDDEASHILSTVDVGEEGALGSTYGYERGTRVAAPHVAGTIALMLQQNPDLTRDRIVGILRTTGYASNGFVSGCAWDDRRCGVLIDASRAVAVVAGDERMPARVPPYPYPPSEPLTNGQLVPVPPGGAQRLYRIEVPAHQRVLEFRIVSPPGEIPPVVVLGRHGRPPTESRNDCNTGGVPHLRVPCLLRGPAAGTWYVRLVSGGSEPLPGHALQVRYYRRPGEAVAGAVNAGTSCAGVPAEARHPSVPRAPHAAARPPPARRC